MRRLTVFNFVTLNGCFKGPNEDISWHRHGEEEGVYSAEMLAAGNALILAKGMETIGQIQNYENMYKLCYVRGPEGIILELAQELK